MHADGDWQAVAGELTKDMATVGEFPQTWKLKPSTTKTVSAAFHLNNKEAKREMKVSFNNETLPYFSETKYFGVTLDRSLTYRRHLESLRKKLTSGVALFRRLAGSGWGAGATTLRTATLALVHSTAEYCMPIWLRSTHTRFIDLAINDALRIVTGCLRPALADNLPILAGIQPPELRHNGATLSLACRSMEPWHMLHLALICLSSAGARRLKSRHPFVPAAQQLISSSDNSFLWQQQHTCDPVGGSPMECGVGGQPHKAPHFHPRHRYPPRRIGRPCLKTHLELSSVFSELLSSPPVSLSAYPKCTLTPVLKNH